MAVRRSRVARAAKLKLGLAAKVTHDRLDGWPVVSYRGRRLAYRVHTVDGTYFRLIVPCSKCHTEIVSRTHHIRGRSDFEDAIDAASIRPAVCRACQTPRTPVVDLSDDLEWPDLTPPAAKRRARANRPLKAKR